MNVMNTMQKSLLINTLTLRKESLKKAIEDNKKKSKDLNIFQTYEKGLLEGGILMAEEEIKAIDVYLNFLQECEKDKLQKELH